MPKEKYVISKFPENNWFEPHPSWMGQGGDRLIKMNMSPFGKFETEEAAIDFIKSLAGEVIKTIEFMSPHELGRAGEAQWAVIYAAKGGGNVRKFKRVLAKPEWAWMP